MLLKRTRVGLMFIIVPLSILFCVFGLFSISHSVFLYYDFFTGEVYWSPVVMFISLISFIPLFLLSWLIIIVGLILLATDALKIANLRRTILSLVLWFLFVPCFFGFAYLILRLGIDLSEPYFLMAIIITVMLWITFPLFLPLMSMMGRKYIKRTLILLLLCGLPALVLSFTDYSEETWISLLPMEVFYLYTTASLIIGYIGFRRWSRTVPRGLKGEEILVHMYFYWHEEGCPAPHQIISRSDDSFITLTVKPVPKESDMPDRSFKLSIAAIAVTVFYSANCLVLKATNPLIETVRRFSIPLFGLGSLGIILVSLAYSGYVVYHIKCNDFVDSKAARRALIISIGAATFFLALTMSIGLYMY